MSCWISLFSSRLFGARTDNWINETKFCAEIVHIYSLSWFLWNIWISTEEKMS